MKNLLDKNLLKIVLLCFLAEPVFINFNLGTALLIDKLMGFKPEKITGYCIQGCFTELWMHPVSELSLLALTLLISITGFLLSRNGFVKNNLNLLLIGAFLFYRAIRFTAFEFINSISNNPLWFIEKKSKYEQMHLQFLGNYFNFKMIQFILIYSSCLLFLILTYQIIFHHWNKLLRIQFLTFGFLSFLIGWVLWHLILVPIIYN